MTLLVISILYWITMSLLGIVFWLIIQAKGFKWFYRNVYLRTWHWRFVRWLKFRQVGKKCQKKGIHSITIDVHHLTYKHMWWEFLFLNDLQVLCRYHHQKEHNG